MPQFISLTTFLTSLVVLGAVQACWYYVYLESPYDYYFRYCNSGCAGIDQNGDDFKQCCIPYTSGQSTPEVCATLSSSCAAAGTTCTWGNVPTTDAPDTTSQVVDSTYVPPAYTPPTTTAQASQTSNQCSASTGGAQPGVITETSWITCTTTTPCPTTSEAAVPTTSEEACNCAADTGSTDNAAEATSSAWEGNTAPASFSADTGKRRRGVMRRSACECATTRTEAAPSSTQAAPETITEAIPEAVTTTSEAPPETTSEQACDCEGYTSNAAEATSSAWEGNTAPAGFSADSRRRRRGVLRRGECQCPLSTDDAPSPTEETPSSTEETPSSTEAYPTTTEEAPLPSTSEEACDCEGYTSNAAESTSSSTWEGNTAPAGFSADTRRRRRGVMRRGECQCPSSTEEVPSSTDAATTTSSEQATTTTEAAPTTTDESCDCGSTSAAAESTAWEGNTAPPTFSADTRKRSVGRRGIMRRGECDCSGASSTGAIVASSYGGVEGNTAPTTWTGGDNRRAFEPRNTAPAKFSADNRKRAVGNGSVDTLNSENHKRAKHEDRQYEGIVRGASAGRENGKRTDAEERQYEGIVRGASTGGEKEKREPNHALNVTARESLEERNRAMNLTSASSAGKRNQAMNVTQSVKRNGYNRSSIAEPQDEASRPHRTITAPVAARDLPTGFSRFYHKRETASTTTCTSTTWVTTDDCAGGAGPTSTADATGTTEDSSQSTSTASQGGEDCDDEDGDDYTSDTDGPTATESESSPEETSAAAETSVQTSEIAFTTEAGTETTSAATTETSAVATCHGSDKRHMDNGQYGKIDLCGTGRTQHL